MSEEGQVIEERREFFVESPLSAEEQRRFEVYEATVEASFSSQTAGVLAAEQIRTERLWRVKWQSFGHYCEDRWQVSQDTMNLRIRAARVIRALDEHVHSDPAENGALNEHVHPNVRQAVELSRLDSPEEQRELWDELTGQPDPVTAKRVEEAVKARKAEAAANKAPDVRERVFDLVKQLPAERDAARALVMMPGLPPDRAIPIVERLLAMPEERSAALLRRWQSTDEREQKAAFAVMQEKHPPADARRSILESLLEEMRHCRDMFPDDKLTFKFRHLVGMAEDLVAALKEQEEERYHATIAA